ncbi:type II toxin-antitoxin system RelE/ParE family toxin [Chromatiaceae bacterium AAb-1]|nr:type II toxin-antitoxin system RelE/ParE family toxin [Chromatiaceae bacterium AAb-1]
MELYWTPEAIQDRSDIYDYIEADNPSAALALDERFSEQANQLIDHPESGRVGLVPGTLELVVHRHYMLVYQVAGDRVQILNVVHTARQWPTRTDADKC